MTRKALSLEQKVARNIAIDPVTGCHNWAGGLNEKGYGRIRLKEGNRAVRVHRVTWEAANGPIPAGIHIDHLCRNRRCCNPEHLEPVTPAENTRRSMPFRKWPDHCPWGHKFDAANTLRGNTGRVCRACNIARKRVYNSRRRAALKQAVEV